MRTNYYTVTRTYYCKTVLATACTCHTSCPEYNTCILMQCFSNSIACVLLTRKAEY
jgi:hypothetical protein